MEEYKSEIRNFRKPMRKREVHVEKCSQVKKQKLLYVTGRRGNLRLNVIR